MEKTIENRENQKAQDFFSAHPSDSHTEDTRRSYLYLSPPPTVLFFKEIGVAG
jgi:hypothetical protein